MSILGIGSNGDGRTIKPQFVFAKSRNSIGVPSKPLPLSPRKFEFKSNNFTPNNDATLGMIRTPANNVLENFTSSFRSGIQ